MTSSSFADSSRLSGGASFTATAVLSFFAAPVAPSSSSGIWRYAVWYISTTTETIHSMSGTRQQRARRQTVSMMLAATSGGLASLSFTRSGSLGSYQHGTSAPSWMPARSIHVVISSSSASWRSGWPHRCASGRGHAMHRCGSPKVSITTRTSARYVVIVLYRLRLWIAVTFASTTAHVADGHSAVARAICST